MPRFGLLLLLVLLSSMSRPSRVSPSRPAASSGNAAAFPSAGAPAAMSPMQGQAMGTSVNRANNTSGLNQSPIFGANVVWPSVGQIPPQAR